MNSSPSTSRRGPKEPISPAARKAAGAGFVGTFIEYYDYGLYGVLTVYLAPLFFPSSDPALSLLVGLGVFGAGFVARPLGGVLIGRLGDRRGRRAALLTSVMLMGASTGLIGLLPTYATIGVLAPILLVVLRLAQGVSAGAELLGSISYVLESAPPSRRAFLSSLTPLGNSLGAAAGALTAAVVGFAVSRDAMLAFGWRIPFLVAVPLALLAFLLRRRVEDSPEFLTLVARKQIAKSPLKETILTYRRRTALACMVALGVNGIAAIYGWMATYLAGTRGLPASMVFLLISISALLVAAVAPVAGWLTDRFGTRRMISTMTVAVLALMVPLLALLGTATAPVPLLVGIVGYLSLTALVTTPGYIYIAELFPTRVRFTGANFGQNIGVVVGGGIGPIAAGALVISTGSGLGPVIWIAAAAALVLVAMAFTPRVLRGGAALDDAVPAPAAPAAPAAPDATPAA